ncbi:hypothetical protein [Microcoleus sp. D2_18a_D3]|uniref:hypothetical protein n=1 Tax=Microcoleus sp. D2_18a_D3 TaxID=3055330 RepID=UPI002FD55702
MAPKIYLWLSPSRQKTDVELRQGWVLFTISSIVTNATNAESNTSAIEQTAFMTLKPPRKLFAMALFVMAGPQLGNKRSNKADAEKPGFSASGEKFQLCSVEDSMNRSIFGILETSTQLS